MGDISGVDLLGRHTLLGCVCAHGTKMAVNSAVWLSLRREDVLKIARHSVSVRHVKGGQSSPTPHTVRQKAMIITVSQVLPQALPRRASRQPFQGCQPANHAQGRPGCRAAGLGSVAQT